MKQFDRIKRYLSGSMPVEERKKIEAELLSDKALQKELRAQQIERTVIRAERKAYFQSIIDEVKHKISSEKK
ncbi:MAG: hypothetical protein AAF849_22505 [Bacteroidota bacterium]